VAAARAASHSAGATTPTKLPFWTTRTPSRSSAATLAASSEAKRALRPGGRITRPYSIPGSRTSEA
jgi:hypothetical protein